MWAHLLTLTSAICTKETRNGNAVRQQIRRVWRRCYFRTEKTESSTVRLVPGGACDALRALLVRDDARDLTLSRPSSGFGTSVMFRNPSWVVYRKPLRSSFCTCLSLSMSCDVVCFFSARPPCGQPQTALTIRRLLWSQEVQRPPLVLLYPEASSDKASSAPSRAALILQQFVYHNRERMGVGFSQVCMVVRCGDAQEAACCECFACDGGGPSWNLLSCRFWQGVYSVRNARYILLVRVDKAPPAMVGCGHTH